MKATISSTLLAASFLLSICAFADETPSGYVDGAVGNNGLSMRVGSRGRFIPDVQFLQVQVELQGGVDSQPGDDVGLTYGASGGLILGTDIFHINPLIKYTCEKAGDNVPSDKRDSYGCGPRAGAKIMIGDHTKTQLGIEWTKALKENNQGENHQIDFMIRVPFSANDSERGNSKTDLDGSKKIKQLESAKAQNA